MLIASMLYRTDSCYIDSHQVPAGHPFAVTDTSDYSVARRGAYSSELYNISNGGGFYYLHELEYRAALHISGNRMRGAEVVWEGRNLRVNGVPVDSGHSGFLSYAFSLWGYLVLRFYFRNCGWFTVVLQDDEVACIYSQKSFVSGDKSLAVKIDMLSEV